MGDEQRESVRSECSRRQFLGRSAQRAAGVAAGFVGLSSAVQAAESPLEQVRVGVIGLRNQGRVLLETFQALPSVHIAGLCDVDAQQFGPAMKLLEAAAQPPVRCETDFRQLLDDPTLDAVVIATPDHWHAWMTWLACQAGKDVYLESPPTHSLSEGALLTAAAEHSGRVVQVGLQQRSGTHFRSAIEAVHSGRLGTVKLARAWICHRRKSIGKLRASSPPVGVDYRLWQGPAPEHPFHANRFHFNWRWFWDYGGGELAHWGVHWLDIARWGLQADVPLRVSAMGGTHAFDDDQETPDTLTVQYDFGGPSLVWEHRLWTGHGIENRSSGVAFYGDRGTLILDRGGWKIYDAAENVSAEGGELLSRHVQNFVDCVKTRQTPAAHLPDGLLSGNLCHWGNASFRLGREIRPADHPRADDLEALLHPGARPGWKLPELTPHEA